MTPVVSGRRVNATAGMKARKQLLTLVANTYAGSAGTLAEWKTASHIVWPQSDGDVSPPAPPGPSN